VEVVEEIPDDELQDWRHQAGINTPATLVKTMKVEDGMKRQEILKWILAAWTSEDRSPALEWLNETLPAMETETAEETIDLLVGGWALESPLEAMEWTNRNMPVPWRETGLKDSAGSWALADLEAMGNWILA
jgi:hypothetical protein